MKDLVYFPYFEPANEEWLKFSLLYLDEFQPIIPYSRKTEVSDNYKRIMGETDLIKPYSPEYILGENAGKKTIEELEKILTNPDSYSSLFGSRNFLEEWKKQEKWDYLVYEEKYSYQFKNYCLEKHLGKKVSQGLMLHRDVAYIFMKYLAQEVAYKTSSSIITDSQGFEKYANFSQIETPTTRELNSLAKSVVQLKLPQNIREIDFAQLIQFRQANRALLKAFHQELEKIENNINYISSVDFLKQFDGIYKEMIIKIGVIAQGFIIVPLKLYSCWENQDASLFDITEIIASSTSSYYALKDVKKQTQNKMQCVKYLANLTNI